MKLLKYLLASSFKIPAPNLEEKKRSEDLAQMLGDEKTKMETMAAGLEVPCANFD